METVKLYQCKRCSFQDINYHVLANHYRNAHPVKQYTCKDCGATFTVPILFAQHRSTKHPKDSGVTKELLTCKEPTYEELKRQDQQSLAVRITNEITSVIEELYELRKENLGLRKENLGLQETMKNIIDAVTSYANSALEIEVEDNDD